MEREKFNFESLDEIIEKFEDKSVESVAIQGPDGIKDELIKIADRLRSKDFNVVIVAASSFGACGIATKEAESMETDALIHVGHTRFLHPEGSEMNDQNVYYLPYRGDRDIISVLKENEDQLPEVESLGIVGVTQYMDRSDKIGRILENEGYNVVEGTTGLRTTEKGQILGCDAGAAHNIAEKVDAFVFLGSGEFHPQQVSETGKPVYVVDPYEKQVRKVGSNSLEDEIQAEHARVLKHKDKQKWGIITSSKPGQNYQRAVEIAKEKLEDHGKDVYVFVENRIFESDFKGFGIDIYVNCACPRMTKDWKDLSLVSPQALDVLDE